MEQNKWFSASQFSGMIPSMTNLQIWGVGKDYGIAPALFGMVGLLLVTIATGFVIMKLMAPRMNLPPGPPALPIVGNWFQFGDDLNHHKLAGLAEQYGDVLILKLGKRNLVVVSSPEAAKEVLHTQGIAFGSRTCNIVFDIFSGRGQDTVFTNYGEHWRKMRRIMTVPFFTTKSVQRMHTVWEEEADHVIKDITASPEATTTGVVIRRRLQLMIYNIMYRMMFDTRFEGEDDPLFVKLRELNGMRSGVTQSFEYNYADFIPILRPFLKPFLDRCWDIKRKRDDVFRGFINNHKKSVAVKGPQSSIGKPGIDHILSAEQNGEINEDNMLYMIENVNAAGTETTLWSIEWGLAELVNNPEMQKRMRDELDEILGKGNLMCEADTHNNKLPYLTAFVKEVMRYHMSIPLLVPHLNVNQEKLMGYDIPAGSRIYVNAWWIGNNPKYWDKPNEFIPERFLNSHMELTGNDFRFLPFGSGRRACPGIAIAMPLVPIVLGRLVQSFELLLPPGVDKIDVAELAGQFSNRIAVQSTIVVKPRPM
ncbi:hypothetical protein M758_1G187600 [Ceratodon purpureus]|nr:hypothetical protein M758_1G187600 [Ceratodon purpureus]